MAALVQHRLFQVHLPLMLVVVAALQILEGRLVLEVLEAAALVV
jgi:hypothetical protein